MPDVMACLWRAGDGDDVKAYLLPYPIFLHVVVDGQLQTPLLAEVNGFFGGTEDAVAARLHFYKYQRTHVGSQCDNVYFAMSNPPVTVANGVAFAL